MKEKNVFYNVFLALMYKASMVSTVWAVQTQIPQTLQQKFLQKGSAN